MKQLLWELASSVAYSALIVITGAFLIAQFIPDEAQFSQVNSGVVLSQNSK